MPNVEALVFMDRSVPSWHALLHETTSFARALRTAPAGSARRSRASRALGRDDDGGEAGGGADSDRARSRARSRLEAKRDRAFVFGAEMFPTRRFVSLTSARDDSGAPLAHLRVDVAPAVRVLLGEGPL
jgi:hypothetical protein